MPSTIAFSAQAPQLPVWPVPTFSARNPSAVWATYVPRLLCNATFLARFRTNWNSAYFARFKTRYSGGTTAIYYALAYLATGNTANVTAAYNAAINQAYIAWPPTADTFWVDGAPYVLDWMWPALTPTQRTNLINYIETNTQNRWAWMNGPRYQLHENYQSGYIAYIFGGLSIQGETGATNRAAEMTRAIQNDQWWLAECSSGLWTDYNYQASLIGVIHIVWELATGQNITTLMGCPNWFKERYHNLIRQMTPDMLHQYPTGIGDQAKTDAGGYLTLADEAFSVAMAGGYFDIPVARWMAATTSGSGANWCLPNPASETTLPVWIAMFYFDPAATQTPPNGVLPPCKGYLAQTNTPGGGNMDASWVAFRDGWNMTSGSTDIIGQFYGAFLYSAHANPGPGHISLQRGMDELLTTGSTYCGSGNNPNGVFCPIQANWTLFSFHNNCAVLSPSGSSTPDASGSATAAHRTSGQLTTFPASGNLIWYPTGGSAIAGRMTKFQQSGTETFASAVLDLAYPIALDPMSYTRSISFIAASKLLIVRDVFTRPNPGRNRFNWWGRSLPTSSGSKAVISRGNSKVTIQCMDAAATLTIFGGTGNEQVIDGVSYPVTTNNCQAGKPVASLAAAVAGQGRATFEVPITSTDVVHALTIDASGATAPTYTLAQLKSLAPLMFGGPIMPGFTQLAQKATLDTEFGVTRYLALFTTQPNDDGTGGVEVSGTNYARVAMLSTDWGAATSGSPATKTSTVAKSFPAAGSGWGTVQGWGFFDAATNGNLRWADYNGNFAWAPFACTSASPGVLFSPAHGLTTNDTVVVTSKYGGTLPATAGSWAGLLTVTVTDADHFTVGVNTTGTGDGQFRKVVTQNVLNTQLWTFQIGALVVSLG